MNRDAESYIRSRSPIRKFGLAIIPGPPRPQGTQTPEGRRRAFTAPRDPRKPLALDVRYVGGADEVWEIRTRGVRWKFSGASSAGDVMRWINALPGY